MNNTKITIGGNLTFWLSVVFIVLKLCGVIDWSWWWVLSLFWIPFTVIAVLIIVYLIVRWFDI